jgi:hypothetical protein
LSEQFYLCLETHSYKAGVTDITPLTPLGKLIMGKRHVMGVSHDVPCRKQVSQEDNKTAHDCGGDRICRLWESSKASIQHAGSGPLISSENQ